MNISTSYKNIESTEAIENHIQEKIGSLDKFIKSESAIARVEVGLPSERHNKGEIFYAEVNLEIDGELIRGQASNEDLYSAINEAKEKIERELIELKDKKLAERRAA